MTWNDHLFAFMHQKRCCIFRYAYIHKNAITYYQLSGRSTREWIVNSVSLCNRSNLSGRMRCTASKCVCSNVTHSNSYPTSVGRQRWRRRLRLQWLHHNVNNEITRNNEYEMRCVRLHFIYIMLCSSDNVELHWVNFQNCWRSWPSSLMLVIMFVDENILWPFLRFPIHLYIFDSSTPTGR